MNQSFQKIAKRALDIVASSLTLALLSPLFLLCAMLIKLTSRGPVFFRWRIISQGGRRITSYKFRTMVEDAEQIEEKLRENAINEMDGIRFKLKNDPRTTRVGKILRKFSIDELPSLYSVLKGDLTLVGPRPVLAREFQRMTEEHKRPFMIAKPGLVSLWVIRGKNKIKSFDEIVKLDLEYIENSSLLYDLKIILKTIPIVVLGKNY